MFSVPKTMLSIDETGLLFSGAHVLAPLCAKTGRLEIEDHETSILAKLSAAYMRPMAGDLAALLRKAAMAWNRNDIGRAAHDLVYARLPDPGQDAHFYERLDLASNALDKGMPPAELMKALNMSAPWLDEARVPEG